MRLHIPQSVAAGGGCLTRGKRRRNYETERKRAREREVSADAEVFAPKKVEEWALRAWGVGGMVRRRNVYIQRTYGNVLGR